MRGFFIALLIFFEIMRFPFREIATVSQAILRNDIKSYGGYCLR